MSPLILISDKADGEMNDDEKINSFLKENKIDPNNFVFANLVHGNNIAEVGLSDVGKRIKKTDGLITGENQLYLGITVSDCLPIYFFTDEVLGIAHAGWKGLRCKIVSRIVDKMIKFEKDKEKWRVVIGPSIGPCHFGVKEDLIEYFKDYPTCFEGDNKGKRLDLKKVAKINFEKRGIKNIEVSSKCTFCEENLFSYRQEGVLKKMLAVIGPTA